MSRYRTIRHYARAYWSRESWVGHQAGIVALSIPPSKSYYSWATGEFVRQDENIIVSAASAPTYGVRTWQLGESAGGGGDSPPQCVHEQHVFGNPFLTHADVNVPGGLDPIAAKVKVRWSCVDIVSNGIEIESVIRRHHDVDDDIRFGTFASSSSATASSGSSSTPHCQPTQTRSTNYLLFADMHQPIVVLYDLHSRRLRPFRPGHSSAICCVKSSRSVESNRAHPSVRLAASGGYDHATCVWDVDTGVLLARLFGGCKETVWCVDLSSKWIATGSDDGKIRLFKLRPNTIQNDEDWKEEEDDITLEERQQRAKEKRRKEMVDMIRRGTTKELSGATSNSTDSSLNVNADRPSRYLNDARFAGPPADPEPPVVTPAAVDSASTAAPSDPNLEFGGRLVCTLSGHTATPMTLQFDPTRPDDRLWSAGYDKTIRLWDISRVHQRKWNSDVASDDSGDTGTDLGECLRVFQGHTSVIFSIILTPHVLFSTSRDGSVKIWDKDTGSLIRDVEAGRNNSELISEISGISESSEGASLTSSRAQSFDIKCAERMSDGRIVTASSDGRIAIVTFQRKNEPPRSRRMIPPYDGTTNNRIDRESPDLCTIM